MMPLAVLEATDATDSTNEVGNLVQAFGNSSKLRSMLTTGKVNDGHGRADLFNSIAVSYYLFAFITFTGKIQ